VNIATEQCGAITIIKPNGALAGPDAQSFKSFALELIHAHVGRVVVDAARIPYVDSQGLESLVDLTEDLARSGKLLKLCALNETLQQVIDLTGLSSQFDSYDDANAAVRSFL